MNSEHKKPRLIDADRERKPEKNRSNSPFIIQVLYRSGLHQLCLCNFACLVFIFAIVYRWSTGNSGSVIIFWRHPFFPNSYGTRFNVRVLVRVVKCQLKSIDWAVFPEHLNIIQWIILSGSDNVRQFFYVSKVNKVGQWSPCTWEHLPISAFSPSHTPSQSEVAGHLWGTQMYS